MTDRERLKAEIERRRKEILESVHEGSERVRREWRELEAKWSELLAETRLRETSEGVEAAARRLGEELLQGYNRIRDALANDREPEPLTEEQRQKVEQLAHELWKLRGRPEGSPEVDWMQAERWVRDAQRSKARAGEASSR